MTELSPDESTSRPGGRRLSRRGFLKILGGATVAALVGSALDALLIEPRWVKLTWPVIDIPRLGRAWDGVRIAHLTDLHVGRLISLDYVRKVVDVTNDAQPDVVVLTGDYVSRRDAIVPALGTALGDLRAPEGVFAVPGNHDYWTDAPAVVSTISAVGIELLTNRHRVLVRDGQGLCIAGVDDLWEGAPDLAAALAGVDEAQPRVLLCHNPDYAEQMPAHPRVDLMLCGHTHGGQVKIPFGGRPRLPIQHVKYAAGLVQGPRCKVYTSVGLGMVGIPVRFNCRPELAIITLRCG